MATRAEATLIPATAIMLLALMTASIVGITTTAQRTLGQREVQAIVADAASTIRTSGVRAHRAVAETIPAVVAEVRTPAGPRAPLRTAQAASLGPEPGSQPVPEIAPAPEAIAPPPHAEQGKRPHPKPNVLRPNQPSDASKKAEAKSHPGKGADKPKGVPDHGPPAAPKGLGKAK